MCAAPVSRGPPAGSGHATQGATDAATTGPASAPKVSKVARWQNLILSLDCARVEGVGAQSKERKGPNFAAQRGGTIVQKPEGTNTYDLKIWL